MKKTLFLFAASLVVLTGCPPQGEGQDDSAPAAEAPKPTITINAKAPDPIPVPARQEAKADDDWAAKVNNKEAEVIELINTLNPVAAYLTEAFKQYGNKFSPALNEEWHDTQQQLTQGLGLYDDCKKRKGEGQVDKKLFLDLEEAWQLLVKTGVAGLRTKSMVDAELQRIAGG